MKRLFVILCAAPQEQGERPRGIRKEKTLLNPRWVNGRDFARVGGWEED